MALSAMGVQIAPLVAGAGVVGIAVGFDAQTFARDVIAGMFYLLDDAFRVGEYIQAGRYKGTVEVPDPFGQAAASPRPGLHCAP
jgi:small-conductance mechanosensitive channel